MDICLDKYKTLKFLSSCGLDVPKYGLVGVNLPADYPVVVKPRRGQGSKGIRKIKSKKPSNIFPPSPLEYSLLPKIHSPSFKLNTVIIGKVIGFPTKVPIKEANTFALNT